MSLFTAETFSSSDIILNITTPKTHYSISKQVLLAGKHVVTANKAVISAYYGELTELAKKNGGERVLGTDCTATNGLDFGTMSVKEGAEIITCPSNAVPAGFEGVDAGVESQKAFAAAIEGAKTILWNGPAGVFECDAFTAGSRAIGEAIAKATAEGAFSLIGGGDSVACVNKFGLADQVSYISTGGGALLEAIEGKVLPGVAAIQG